MKRLLELRESIKTLATEQLEAVEAFKDRDATAEEFEACTKRAADIEAQVQEIKKLEGLESAVVQAQNLVDVATRPAGRSILGSIGDGKGTSNHDDPTDWSLGETFTKSEDFQAWFKAIAPTGHVNEKIRITSPAVEMPKGMTSRLMGRGQKIITSTGSDTARPLIQPDLIGGVDMLGMRPLMLRDIVTVGTTQSDSVEFVRELTQTNNAAPVAEATASGGTSGVKPESTFTLEKVTTTVKTIAHWVAATKRALADAGQMRTLIDNFLTQGLAQTLEDQIATGDGIGENLLGISNITGVQAQAWDTSLLVTTRRAKTKVRTVGRAIPQAYLLNPTDWESMQLIRDDAGGAGTGQFLLGGPGANADPARLWNLPVVESEAVPVGTGYVGDFRRCILWDREQANVQVSDSHSDFFIRNLLAILGELRAAFGCIRPSALVEMDLTP